MSTRTAQGFPTVQEIHSQYITQQIDLVSGDTEIKIENIECTNLQVDNITDVSGSGISLGDTLKVDTITEKTSSNGVTIEGFNLEDSEINTTAATTLVAQIPSDTGNAFTLKTRINGGNELGFAKLFRVINGNAETEIMNLMTSGLTIGACTMNDLGLFIQNLAEIEIRNDSDAGNCLTINAYNNFPEQNMNSGNILEIQNNTTALISFQVNGTLNMHSNLLGNCSGVDNVAGDSITFTVGSNQTNTVKLVLEQAAGTGAGSVSVVCKKDGGSYDVFRVHDEDNTNYGYTMGSGSSTAFRPQMKMAVNGDASNLISVFASNTNSTTPLAFRFGSGWLADSNPTAYTTQNKLISLQNGTTELWSINRTDLDFPSVTSDPSVDHGKLWYRSDLSQMRFSDNTAAYQLVKASTADVIITNTKGSDPAGTAADGSVWFRASEGLRFSNGSAHYRCARIDATYGSFLITNKVETAAPVASEEGAICVMDDSSGSGNYYLGAYIDGAWRKVLIS